MNKILVIEDNNEIRENTAEILELNGYHVCTAENGSAGYESAKSYHPDIILCDIMMPETDGREFMRLVKADLVIHNIPIVFFSAGTSIELQQELANGKNAYLKKPFSESELLFVIRNGLDRIKNHFNQNHNPSITDL
jgi:CheY-like chemotaxis protein